MLVIVKQHLVKIGRINGPTAEIRFWRSQKQGGGVRAGAVAFLALQRRAARTLLELADQRVHPAVGLRTLARLARLAPLFWVKGG